MTIKTMRGLLLLSAALLCTMSTDLSSAVFLVTNTNNQGPGSLRQAIENLNTFGGATNEIIVSLVDGKIIIVLLSALPTISKQVTLNGFDQVSQQPVIIEGGNLVTIGLHVSGSNASNTHITNLTIQNVHNNVADGPAYGILIDNTANGCSITNCTLQHIASGVGPAAEATGIKADITIAYVGSMINNNINTVTSADNGGGDTGPAFGINIPDVGTNTIPAECSHNTIFSLQSGNSSQLSGSALAIDVRIGLHGNCIGNAIAEIRSGESTNGSSDLAAGIVVRSNVTGSCSDNTITNIHSGNAHLLTGGALGITLMNDLNGNCNGNTIGDISTGNSATETSGPVGGINVDNTVGGTCTKNTISHLTSGSALNAISGNVDGIRIDGQVGITAHNNIQQLHSGQGNNESGEVKGIDIQHGNGRCSYNIIDTLISGNAIEESGDVEGIEFDGIFTGDCTDNTIKNLLSGNASNQLSGHVFGIHAEDDFIGNCLNNTVCNLTVGTIDGSPAIQGEAIGIRFDGTTNPILTACNQICNIVGGPSTGIMFLGGVDSIVQLNIIRDIQATGANNNAIGIEAINIIGFLIALNTISDIHSNDGSGFGINLSGESSDGEPSDNDILTNSIFNIDTKAINIIANGIPTDVVQLVLTSVRCGVNNRIIISGILIPQPELDNRIFLLQFFVSDSDIPEQIQTFIGEYEHDASSGNNFTARFVVQAPTQFGQVITATATALPNGSSGSSSENINTSEVSNALSACETQGGVCTLATCPTEPKPIPPAPCPALSNCPGIDVL